MTTAVTPFSHMMNSFFAPAACSARDEDCARRLTPRADILEGDRDYIIRMDLPGVNRQDLEIEIDGETMTIAAERDAAPDEGYRSLRSERSVKAKFHRTFELGRGIDRDGVSASMVDGTLTLTLPKNEQAVARRIEVE